MLADWTCDVLAEPFARSGVMLAAALTALPGHLGRIFYFIILPMLLLIAVGFVVQRKLGLDMPTLAKLNFYFVIPALIYASVVSSPLGGREVITVVAFSVAMVACMAAAAWGVARLRRVRPEHRNVLMMTTMFYNSGNYGLPLQDMAFQRAGLSVQATSLQVFVVLVQNVMTFTAGVLLAAAGKRRHWKSNLLHILRFPPLYALAAALLTLRIARLAGDYRPQLAAAAQPFWNAIGYARAAFVAVALATLGAQLAVVRRQAGVYPVRLTVLVRLLIGPIVGLALVYLMGIRGFEAQLLLISTSTPTAVNCMLLCVEFDNHPDYAAASVFYSTLLSPITVTLVVFLAQSGLLPGFAVAP